MSQLLSLAASDPTWLNNPALTEQLLPALGQTAGMTVLSTLVSVLFGLPLGIWLFVTAKGGLAENLVVNRVLSTIVDFGRSIPFIILIIALIPFTRFMVGSALGWKATVVPLAVGAIPFFARLVENALREVSVGKVEAVLMMGGSRGQVIRQVLVPEALPALVGAATVTAVALVNYSAMAGAVGGGGLGDFAISYGYHRYQSDVMISCILVLVAFVGIIQFIGDRTARALDHR